MPEDVNKNYNPEDFAIPPSPEESGTEKNWVEEGSAESQAREAEVKASKHMYAESLERAKDIAGSAEADAELARVLNETGNEDDFSVDYHMSRWQKIKSKGNQISKRLWSLLPRKDVSVAEKAEFIKYNDEVRDLTAEVELQSETEQTEREKRRRENIEKYKADMTADWRNMEEEFLLAYQKESENRLAEKSNDWEKASEEDKETIQIPIDYAKANIEVIKAILAERKSASTSTEKPAEEKVETPTVTVEPVAEIKEASDTKVEAVKPQWLVDFETKKAQIQKENEALSNTRLDPGSAMKMLADGMFGVLERSIIKRLNGINTNDPKEVLRAVDIAGGGKKGVEGLPLWEKLLYQAVMAGRKSEDDLQKVTALINYARANHKDNPEKFIQEHWQEYLSATEPENIEPVESIASKETKVEIKEKVKTDEELEAEEKEKNRIKDSRRVSPEAISTASVTAETEKPSKKAKGKKSKAADTSLSGLEKELGFVDIKASEIMAEFSAEDLVQMQKLTEAHFQAYHQYLDQVEAAKKAESKKRKKSKKSKVEDSTETAEENIVVPDQSQLLAARAELVAFYKSKVEQILKSKDREELMSEEQLNNSAENLQNIINQTIEFELNKSLSSFSGQKSNIIKSAAWSAAIMGGTTAAMVVLAPQLATLGLGMTLASVATAGGASAISVALRRAGEEIGNRRSKSKQKGVEKEREKVINNFFADQAKLKNQISGAISNVLRDQTNEQAKEVLNNYKAEKNIASDIGDRPGLDKVTEELYYRAFSMLSNSEDHSENSLDQLRDKALLIAVTLAQHERGKNIAQANLEQMKLNKPKEFAFIERFNLAASGFKKSEKPDDLGAKVKHDTLSILTGTAIGLAVRNVYGLRQVTGTMAGAGLGLKAANLYGRKKEADRVEEILQIINDTEKVILDSNDKLVSDKEKAKSNWGDIKNQAQLVESKLNLGLLDSNLLVKNRAQNFLHLVQQREFEIQNNRANDILGKLEENRKVVEEKVGEEIRKLSKKEIKKRYFVAGGAVLGLATSLVFSSVGKAAAKGAEHVSDTVAKTAHDVAEKVGNHHEDHKGPSYVYLNHAPVGADTRESIAAAAEADHAPAQTSHYPNATEKFPLTADPDKPIDSDPSWLPGHKNIAGQPPIHLDAQHSSSNERFPLTADPDAVPKGEQKPWVPAMDKEHEGRLSNIIDSREVKGSDSIWKSTREIVLQNPEKFGYHGDIHNQAELQKFAEHQTANLVHQLEGEQGGHINDLVHNGDKVVIDFEHGKAHLNFVASSGIEAGHLPEHPVELASSPANSEVVVPPLENVSAKLDDFIECKGVYEADLYQVAKDGDKMTDLFHSVLESKNWQNIENFTHDYCRDHNWPASKETIFYNQLQRTQDLANYNGTMDDLAKTFDQHQVIDFASVKNTNSSDWQFVRLGNDGDYAMISKYKSGFFVFKDTHYLIDTNGDGRPEFSIDGDKALEQAFKQGHFSQKVTPEVVAPAKANPVSSVKVETPTTNQQSPWGLDHKVLEGQTHSSIETKPVETIEPKPLNNEQNMDNATAQKIIDQNFPDVHQDGKIAEVAENLKAAVASINRGDPELKFDLSKIDKADEPYLIKIKEDADGMLAFLRNSPGANPALLKGYRELLDLIDNRLAK